MVKRGIDVSQYQGMIRWEEVRNYIDFAILRCGYGKDTATQDDTMFTRNADECTRLQIPFGVYLYSYAQNESDALSEAKHVMRLIANYQMAYPIYLDIEDPSVEHLSLEQIERNCEVFAKTLESNRYFPGFYASYYWWTTKLTSAFFNRYTKWIARYADVLGIDGFDMWQYTNEGVVQGIDGPVDRNVAFRDFPKEIIAGGYNHFKPIQSTYQLGDHVTFREIFVSSDSQMPLRPYMNHGTITHIQAGARNPYLINRGMGWVNDQVITGRLSYLANPSYQGTSLSDALAEIGIDASFVSRKRIAAMNGIDNYTGTTAQNLMLLELLRTGKLKYI